MAESQEAWISSQTEHATKITEDYVNEQYGFKTPMLANLSAFGAQEPNPNHGLFYILGYKRRISIWADYDALFLGSLKGHRNHFIESWEISSPKERRYTLSGKPALMIDGHCPEGAVTAILHYGHQRHGILYYLVLQTDDAHYAEDRKLFLELAGKFAFVRAR